MTEHAIGSLEALAQVIAERVKRGQAAKPILRAVPTPRSTLFDSITREGMYKRIRWLRRTYDLAFVIDQATFNVPNIECLEDRDLSRLLQTMERARECRNEGISFEDAGLISNTADCMPDEWTAC